MNLLYTRISSIDQKSLRQTQNSKDFDYLIEDRCSGATPFFDREGGKQIEKMVYKNQVSQITVHAIDRLGRNLLDILNTIAFFNKKGICIHFIQQGIKTLNEDGTENPISKMIISILGVVAEMERNLIRERQAEGVAIAIAKANGIYKGRAKGTRESNLDFLK
jgi:DNA invertase Pin-like site-specific DNA recombinase